MVVRPFNLYNGNPHTWEDNLHIETGPRLLSSLTHWGRVMHICVSKLTIIGSDNGLSPGRWQAITWTNAGILLTGTLGTNFNEILIKIYQFSFKKIHFKMSSGKWWPSCLGLNMLRASFCKISPVVTPFWWLSARLQYLWCETLEILQSCMKPSTYHDLTKNVQLIFVFKPTQHIKG